MRKHPKVSVVIPIKGRRKLVRKTVLSVLSQTVEDFEVIVVIDGKTSELTYKMLFMTCAMLEVFS